MSHFISLNKELHQFLGSKDRDSLFIFYERDSNMLENL